MSIPLLHHHPRLALQSVLSCTELCRLSGDYVPVVGRVLAVIAGCGGNHHGCRSNCYCPLW